MRGFPNFAVLPDRPPNGLEIAKHPVGEPPGQLFDTSTDPIRRSWPGRSEIPEAERRGLHRVVSPPDGQRPG